MASSARTGQLECDGRFPPRAFQLTSLGDPSSDVAGKHVYRELQSATPLYVYRGPVLAPPLIAGSVF